MAGGGICDRHIIRGHRNCHRMRTLRYCAVVMGTLSSSRLLAFKERQKECTVVMGTLSSPLLLYLTSSLLPPFHHHFYCLPFIIIFIASLLSSFLLPPFYHLRFCSSSLRRRPKLCLARGEEKQATSLFRREPENIIVVIYKYK